MTHNYSPFICASDVHDRVDTMQPREFVMEPDFQHTQPSMPAPLYGHKTGRHVADPRPFWRGILIPLVVIVLVALGFAFL